MSRFTVYSQDDEPQDEVQAQLPQMPVTTPTPKRVVKGRFEVFEPQARSGVSFDNLKARDKIQDKNGVAYEIATVHQPFEKRPKSYSVRHIATSWVRMDTVDNLKKQGFRVLELFDENQ